MTNLKSILHFAKENKQELQIIKIMVLIAINTWLLIIFWKTLLIENVFMINNVGLTKMQTVIQPVLQILGLEMLTPNMIKMLMITTIVITANLMVLHFQTIISIMITAIIARYGYKMYTNYLINSENMMQISSSSIPTTQIAQKVVDQAPIVINTGASTGTSWWVWGTVAVVGAIAIGAIIFTYWSHQTNANNMLDLNDITYEINKNTNEAIREIDVKTTRAGQYMDQLTSNVNLKINSVDTKTDLVNKKIIDLENGFQEFGIKIAKLEENNIENVKILSENTLEMSKEAKEFFGNVLESNTATEALIVSIAKLVDGFNEVTERLITTETKLESLTGATTPRSSMYRTTPTMNIPSRFNNPTNINE